MLDELCAEIKNYFDKGQKKLFGKIEIVDGVITNDEFTSTILTGQYFRIVNSALNDGIYCYNNELVLNDETFDGAIWFMAVPKAVIDLSRDIDKWVSEYSNANSPFQSESFGGYSYTKGNASTWQEAFKTRLNAYRRIRI